MIQWRKEKRKKEEKLVQKWGVLIKGSAIASTEMFSNLARGEQGLSAGREA